MMVQTQIKTPNGGLRTLAAVVSILPQNGYRVSTQIQVSLGVGGDIHQCSFS